MRKLHLETVSPRHLMSVILCRTRAKQSCVILYDVNYDMMQSMVHQMQQTKNHIHYCHVKPCSQNVPDNTYYHDIQQLMFYLQTQQ